MSELNPIYLTAKGRVQNVVRSFFRRKSFRIILKFKNCQKDHEYQLIEAPRTHTLFLCKNGMKCLERRILIEKDSRKTCIQT